MIRPWYKLLVCQAHRISRIDGIVVAVAEEVVIASIEHLRVFAHKPAQLRVVRAGAVLVEIKRWAGAVVGPVGGRILAPGEQETVIVNSACASAPGACVDRRRAEGVVAISLNNIAACVSQLNHAAFMVLLRVISIP